MRIVVSEKNNTIGNIAPYLDFASHRADTTQKMVDYLCEQALHYGFNSAFVNPCYVQYAKNKVRNTKKVGTVVSFPLGQDVFSVKVLSLQESLRQGADELDVVLNVAFIKEHQWQKCYEEMATLVSMVRDFASDRIIKFIPETGYLTPDEIKKVAELMVKAKADFFKTCSGYGPRGATVEDVKLIRAAVGNDIKIKVAGGISSYEKAVEFLQAGAQRIGTSKAIEIIKEYEQSVK